MNYEDICYVWADICLHPDTTLFDLGISIDGYLVFTNGDSVKSNSRISKFM